MRLLRASSIIKYSKTWEASRGIGLSPLNQVRDSGQEAGLQDLARGLTAPPLAKNLFSR